ncbi:hypothetical protein DFH07DRAFT_765033 [Mycena maculata]|uniref:Uncharacterized protein n=1 Tax=Mycena maculata TaxID=230809 RepID=A0AAD7K101_9AGAR|nr:hypothetical protein DFH07DRAFT_766970 [Mycena maculata]KAJ7782044.1 hypothetical protein DFH07DRAFT_765021 [Mycena maculata]KAJ7782054.1 hypothetical protein DFH07DRAFT_765033 [Mycena maculata]
MPYVSILPGSLASPQLILQSHGPQFLSSDIQVSFQQTFTDYKDPQPRLMCLRFRALHGVHPPGRDQVNVLPIDAHLFTSPLARWTEILIPVPDFLPTTSQYITGWHATGSLPTCCGALFLRTQRPLLRNPAVVLAHAQHGDPSSAMRRRGWNLTAVESAPASSNALDRRRPTASMVTQLQTRLDVYIAASILLVVLIGFSHSTSIPDRIRLGLVAAHPAYLLIGLPAELALSEEVAPNGHLPTPFLHWFV